eukprot:TRINITY_DN8092_c0_g1_i1.p1 TRINITY_DN8092_c0_g1~~TRINITY_DN8092_c0_g1_i1.p1  ORF type:complete len:191 (+),score=28.39 TRINITY_DN8092_c0_g1_i1:162-734(+)
MSACMALTQAARHLRCHSRASVAMKAKSRPFDEGAAQVANLLQRDEAELTGKSGIGGAAFEEFGQEAGADTLATVEDFPDAFKSSSGGDSASSSAKGTASKVQPASPFGASASRTPSSPFGDMTTASSSDLSNMSPNMDPDPINTAPWWTKITPGQIILFFTFTAMTLSMVATVLVVAKTGAIHFNDDKY